MEAEERELECRFDELWQRLQAAIKPQTDQVLVYTLDAAAARRRKRAGGKSVLTEKRSYYVLYPLSEAAGHGCQSGKIGQARTFC